ncbi:MAG: copper-binding protein [Hyphomicrobiaceae bacterium]
MHKLFKTALAVSACFFTTAVHATETHKGHGDHGAMSHEAKTDVTEAEGVGVINAIDTTKKEVNLTHEPMSTLGWPSMTMDLPVTAKVDLGTVKAGDKVSFRLKLGRDKVYRITEIAPAK